MNTVVYVPPVYEEIQHEPTLVSSDGTVLQVSLHSDVSLLMRIQSLKCDANTLSILKDSLQPVIDSSNYRAQFEDSFGKLTDKDLIDSCPSRYVQTRSEQMAFLRSLAEKDKEARDKYAKSLKEKEEQDRIKKESDDFQSRLKELLK
jgi:hypothetical protein